MTVDINSQNFNEYFFNVRQHKPQKGQVMARFRAVAELIDGDEKRFLIQLLQKPNAARAIATTMQRLFYADEESAWQVPREMGKDLLSGMTEEQVAQKDYEFTAEFYYYVQPEYVPRDDPHWDIIQVIDSRDFIETKVCPTPKNSDES